ncbi:hypothetical protein BDQ17DRAFT_1333641 [Cyathus striatus]|nr:hypothetical protein BDQ17DRAFT_1333641 [Cyathus striatus]
MALGAVDTARMGGTHQSAVLYARLWTLFPRENGREDELEDIACRGMGFDGVGIHLLPTSHHYELLNTESPPACDKLRVGHPGRAEVVAYRYHRLPPDGRHLYKPVLRAQLRDNKHRRTTWIVRPDRAQNGLGRDVDTCSLAGVDKNIRLAPQSLKIWSDAAERREEVRMGKVCGITQGKEYMEGVYHLQSFAWRFREGDRDNGKGPVPYHEGERTYGPYISPTASHDYGQQRYLPPQPPLSLSWTLYGCKNEDLLVLDLALLRICYSLAENATTILHALLSHTDPYLPFPHYGDTPRPSHRYARQLHHIFHISGTSSNRTVATVPHAQH